MNERFCSECGHLWAWHGSYYGCNGVPSRQLLGGPGECGCEKKSIENYTESCIEESNEKYSG